MECLEGDHIKFDFLGKDSIRYENEVKAHPKVWRLVEKFCRKDGGNKGEPRGGSHCLAHAADQGAHLQQRGLGSVHCQRSPDMIAGQEGFM